MLTEKWMPVVNYSIFCPTTSFCAFQKLFSLYCLKIYSCEIGEGRWGHYLCLLYGFSSGSLCTDFWLLSVVYLGNLLVGQNGIKGQELCLVSVLLVCNKFSWNCSLPKKNDLGIVDLLCRFLIRGDIYSCLSHEHNYSLFYCNIWMLSHLSYTSQTVIEVLVSLVILCITPEDFRILLDKTFLIPIQRSSFVLFGPCVLLY